MTVKEIHKRIAYSTVGDVTLWDECSPDSHLNKDPEAAVGSVRISSANNIITVTSKRKKEKSFVGLS